MKLEFVSCKSTAQAMVVIVRNVDTGLSAAAAVDSRVSGGPFLTHDAAVGQLVRDLLVAIAMTEPAAVEQPAVELETYEGKPTTDAGVPVAGTQAIRKGKTLPPKGAA